MDTIEMKSVIIGAGKYGEVYLSYLREAGVNVIGFLDDDETLHSKRIWGLPIFGDTTLLPDLRSRYGVEAIYCPIGSNRIRSNFLEEARRCGYLTPNFIHRDVIVSPDVEIASEGVYILCGTILMPHVKIEKDVMISVGTSIVHHTVLRQGVFVSNGVNVGASIIAEKYAYIGMGSTIMTGVTRIGTDCLIGAGAVVIRDVPDGAVMAGLPAKIIKYKPEYAPQEPAAPAK